MGKQYLTIFKNSFLFSVIFFFLISEILFGQSMQINLEDLLPSNLEGWVVEQNDQRYDKDNVYDYINGGAELFLSYGFQSVFNRTYSKPDQPDILVDIFDMATSYNAYGVFSYSREKEDSSFGQGSQYVPGLLLFWKNQYYISILFSPKTEESELAAIHIARYIDSSIAMEGPVPEILKLLPEESLLKESIRYFRHYIWINSYQFIANDNILNITDSTNAVLAKYGKKDETLLLLLINYPIQPDAESARDNFINSYLPELSKNPIAQKDNIWIGCQMYDNILAIVFNGKHKESIKNMMNQIKHK